MVTLYLRRKYALLAALILAGCTVGPDYHLPDKALVNNPVAQGRFITHGDAAQSAAPPDNWWYLYNNPTLNALILRAFAANTDLRIAEANLESSDALLAKAKTAQQVDATGNLDTSYVQQSAEAVLQNEQPPQRQIYNTGISVSYDVDMFGGIRRGVEAATDDSEAARFARDLVRVNVAAETTRAYAEICDSGNELAALHNSIDLQNQADALTQLMRENGRAVSFDVAHQQSVTENLQSQIPMLQARQMNAAYRLSTLLGQPPQAFDPAWLTCHKPLQMAQPVPIGDGQSLLKRRPDVREAERRLAAATARIGVATASLYPDIKFGASVGSTGSAASLFSPLTNRFGIGPMISWDINQSAARARIAQAKAQTRGRLAAFDGTVLSALLETQTRLNSYSFELDRLADLTDARNHAAQIASSMNELHAGGRVDAMVALNADQKLAAANQAVADAQTDVNQSQIALFLALGGGWNTPPH